MKRLCILLLAPFYFACSDSEPTLKTPYNEATLGELLYFDPLLSSDSSISCASCHKPEFAFAFSHDVYIIGLSLAHDDFFVRSFFLSNLPFLQDYSGVIGRNVFIINPAATAQAEYDFVLSRGYAEFINEKFSLDHVAKMAAALTDA